MKKILFPFVAFAFSSHLLYSAIDPSQNHPLPSDQESKLTDLLLVHEKVNPKSEKFVITVALYASLCNLIATTEDSYQRLSHAKAFHFLDVTLLESI